MGKPVCIVWVIPPSQNGIKNTLHTDVKSVKIEGYESPSHHSDDIDASDTAVSIRRPSTESASMAAKRVSTCSERTMVMSDKCPRSGQTRLVAATTNQPQTTAPAHLEG